MSWTAPMVAGVGVVSLAGLVLLTSPAPWLSDAPRVYLRALHSIDAATDSSSTRLTRETLSKILAYDYRQARAAGDLIDWSPALVQELETISRSYPNVPPTEVEGFWPVRLRVVSLSAMQFGVISLTEAAVVSGLCSIALTLILGTSPLF